MTHFRKLKARPLPLILLIGLVIVSVIPVRSWASAQSNSAPLWVVRSLPTSEFGVNTPKGLAFSPIANTFLLLDGSTDITLVTMGEDHAGTRMVPEVQDDALNTAFDDQAGSLFVFERGKSELAQIRADDAGLPDASAAPRGFGVNAFGIKDPQGIAFDPATGRLFVLDAGSSQIISVVSHPTLGFDADEAIRSNKVERIALKKLGTGSLQGIAYNPSNGHLYVSEPGQKRLYELTQSGDLVSTFDLASLGINNPSAMTFAPSGDTTDDPNTMDLYLLDGGQSTTKSSVPSSGQIVELSLLAPAALPAGTPLLPTTLVHTIDASNKVWNPSAPDTTGIDYWPLKQHLLISDSEVEEMPNYFQGKNIFEATTSGTLVSTCSTTSYSNEPTGLAINSNNNHIFISDDTGAHDKVYEVSLGADGAYCTADDTVNITDVAVLYGATDAEDVAYGNNTLFVADGINAEVYRIPLGANGVLGGGDDGAMTHWDTAALGFSNVEGLGYNADTGTLFMVSGMNNSKYLEEITTTGTLLRAYNLNYPIVHTEDVTFAPGSQNAGIKNVYITDRGVDNNSNPNENDGKVWEIGMSSPSTPTPTFTPGPSPTPTNTPPVTDLIFADGFESGNLSAWTSNSNDLGDLSVSTTAALAPAGSRGMQALLDDNTAIYVTDDTPTAEPRYRARFYFDPNSISMASGDAHNIFFGYAGTSTAVLRGAFRFSSGAYQVRLGLLNDGGTWLNTIWFTISDVPHTVEFDWRAATAVGANDGGLTLWIDGVQKANLTGVDNDTRRIDRARLGAVSGIDTGTRGTYYFDAFESRRQSYIGP